MKRFLLLGAAIAAAVPTAGSAAVTLAGVFSSPVVVNPAQDPGFASLGQTLIYDFDTMSPVSGALTGDFAIAEAPGTPGVSAAPSGTAAGTFYLTVPIPGPSGTATLDLGGEFRTLSFYWGSVDTYNTITLIQADGTQTSFAGGALGFGIDPDGNQTSNDSNVRVNFLATGRGITSLRFESTQFAFETDTFAGTAVPEPSTWMMMLGGFGAVGALRRRSRRAATVTA